MFDLIIGIGEAIWGFFQTGIDAVVASLVWAVGVIQATIVLLWNGIKGALDLARIGFVKSWDFLGTLYDDVLKPAWQTFGKYFDKLRTWLNKTFGPLLTWLRNLRSTLLKFWATYVRPWLDLIDVTRKALRVLASLGLTWARELDKQLAALEEKIQAPFLYLLSALNQVINLVNTIVGADGLLQRVALIRSLARDYQYAWRAVTAPYDKPVDDATRQATNAAFHKRSPAAVQSAIEDYMTTGGGPLAPVLDEMADVWRGYFENGLPTTTQ